MVKTIVSVIVFDRIDNIRRWLSCWAQCDQPDAELVIIHTGDGNEISDLCNESGVRYIHRINQGFDIGAFQDVCRERLTGFPEDWDYLLWCTDDTLPMRKDFVQQFIQSMAPGVGVSCMEISVSSPGGVWHVRTTGFCIERSTAFTLKFPADPVATKQHCYGFEHRAGKLTMTEQVRAMGLSCDQVSPLNVSPLWDSLHPNKAKRTDRKYEFNEMWGITQPDKVAFICTIFNTYPQIISSLILQTHKNWELILIHDGPSSNGMLGYIGNDPRIKYIETKERLGKWGHPHRQWALNEIKEGRLSNPDYIVVSNADNYYTPAFITSLLTGFIKPDTVATYCESIIHSYIGWGVMACRFERGFLDCGGVMIKKDIACNVGWRDTETHSADWKYFKDIADRYLAKNFVSVPGCLFVHN